MNGEDLHTEESFDALSAKEQLLFGENIDALEIQLRTMVRQLTEWERNTAKKYRS